MWKLVLHSALGLLSLTLALYGLMNLSRKYVLFVLTASWEAWITVWGAFKFISIC